MIRVDLSNDTRSQGSLPDLRDDRCTGCAWCVEGCPTGCLEMRGPLPWLPRPLDCVSCALCAEICPTHAITMIYPGNLL